ncbi:hypothetical protein V144x_30000 [Gimesia aquarii]|uniref:Uncharacterized protein n=1 Tax=Gimesia aquarii TaxID=2527964 RepID=A0A517VWZ6_9PLAN|nr:hypothetical protein V144x_30000 [Gimesia aquarii]
MTVNDRMSAAAPEKILPVLTSINRLVPAASSCTSIVSSAAFWKPAANMSNTRWKGVPPLLTFSMLVKSTVCSRSGAINPKEPEPGVAPSVRNGEAARPLKSRLSTSPGPGNVGSPPFTVIGESAVGRMLKISASSPPLMVVCVASTLPNRSTVEPTGSGSPPLGSTLISIVVVAITSPPSASRKSSPAFRTTLAPVDSTVTPALIVRSSPGPAESPAVRVTDAPVTSAATVKGLAAETSTAPPASTPFTPSTEPISKAPVLLTTILLLVESAANVATAVSISEAPGAPIPKAASSKSSVPAPPLTKGASPAVLSKMVPVTALMIIVPPALCRSAIRRSPVPLTSRSPPRAFTRPPSVCVNKPPPALSLSAVKVTMAAVVVSTTEVAPRFRSLDASRSMVPPLDCTVALTSMSIAEVTLIGEAAPLDVIFSLTVTVPPVNRVIAAPPAMPESPSTVPISSASISLISTLPRNATAASVLTAVSILSPLPISVPARNATSFPVINAASKAVLSIIDSAMDSTVIVPPILCRSAIRTSSVALTSKSPPRAVTILNCACVN